MTKALVTGANGFIGSALCDHLVEQGIEVIGVIRNEHSDISRIKHYNKIEAIFCESVNYKIIDNLIPDRDIDVVFHLAWEGSEGELRSDYNVQNRNVISACDLAYAVERLGCREFVFAASIMQYETYKQIGMNKSLPKSSIYSIAKSAADQMIHAVACSTGMKYLSAIISNVYGPGEINNRLINSSIRKMLRGERCSFSPGEQLYDFIYISDAVRALSIIGTKGEANHAYYVGSPAPKKLKEFLIEMRNVVDETIELGLGDLPYMGVGLSYEEFDCDYLRREWGFTSEISFKEGIFRTKEWLEENRNEWF